MTPIDFEILRATWEITIENLLLIRLPVQIRGADDQSQSRIFIIDTITYKIGARMTNHNQEFCYWYD